MDRTGTALLGAGAFQPPRRSEAGHSKTRHSVQSARCRCRRR
jgi:hypothetical protein